MAITTISEAINRGYVSTYLSGNDNAVGALFGRRLAAPGSQISINMITDALYWGYSGGAQSSADLRQMANYLVWLIGKYGQQAQVILEGSGGGTVIPINPGGSTPFYYDFIVDASTSFIISGTTSKTFPSTWIGFNIQFFRGGELQSTTLPSFGTYYSWNSGTAVLTLLAVAPSTAAAQDDERFQIYPVI